MIPKLHILINFFISLPFLYILSPLFILIFFLSSVLIDTDHYFYYVFKKKKISLRKAYNWFLIRKNKLKKMSREERKKHAGGILIFHGIEPLIVLLIFSKIYPVLFFVFLGFLVHMIEDLIEDLPLGTANRKISILYSLYLQFAGR